MKLLYSTKFTMNYILRKTESANLRIYLDYEQTFRKMMVPDKLGAASSHLIPAALLGSPYDGLKSGTSYRRSQDPAWPMTGPESRSISIGYLLNAWRKLLLHVDPPYCRGHEPTSSRDENQYTIRQQRIINEPTIH